MKIENRSEAIAACEAVLREERHYNRDHHILPRQIALIDHLLERTPELGDAYVELHAKLAERPFGLMAFFRALLTAADLWNPDNLVQAREDREKLRLMNANIADTAFELANLLEERDRLKNQSDFHSDTHYHIVDVIDEASQHNPSFQSWVKQKLDALISQFDLKYWPALHDVVAVIGKDALRAKITPYHAPAAAGTSARRSSRADFMKALLATIDENIGDHSGYLPKRFSVSDASLASLGNCVLGLSPDDGLMEAEYVKHVRQRERCRTQPTSIYPSRRERAS